MIKRLDYIDEIRGLAILLVVIGNLIQFNGVSTNHPVFEFIYSFHMPLFFAVSGYITEKVTFITNYKQYALYLKKKIISLIIPLFTWSLLVSKFVLAEHWNTITWENIYNIISSPGLWFLKMLFVILFFYGIFNYICNILKIKTILNFAISLFTIVSISLLIVFIGIMEINFIMFSFAFYVGVIISKYKKIEEICLGNVIYTISTVVFIVLSTHWNFMGNVIDDIYKIIISTSAFIFFLNLFTKINLKNKAKEILLLFGRYSLSIYVIQFYLCNIYNGDNIGYYISNINYILCFIIVCMLSIPLCYICVITAKIIETNKFLSFIMLGKKV